MTPKLDFKLPYVSFWCHFFATVSINH